MDQPQIGDLVTAQSLGNAWLEAWMKASQSATGLAWAEFYRRPVQLGRFWMTGAMQMQGDFVRHSTALLNGGLFDAEEMGKLYTDYAQLTDQNCADQMVACDRFIELAQAAAPGVPLQQIQQTTLYYLALYRAFPARRTREANNQTFKEWLMPSRNA